MPVTSFFDKQLPGEDPLTLPTAQVLCAMAALVEEAEPWLDLDETELFFIGDTGESLACSVMGALGQVFALAVHRGPRGLKWFRDIQQQEKLDAGKFIAEQECLTVEFVKRKELTRYDRELLAEVGYPSARGGRVPRFRSSRFGYHPWYINEEEGVILAYALRSALALDQQLLENAESGGAFPFWSEEGNYPRILVNDLGRATIEPYSAPSPTLAMPRQPALDERRINALLRKRSGQSCTLELGLSWLPARIGKPQERQACIRLALAVDSTTGMAFNPSIAAADADAAELLHDALLKAMENGAAPQRILLSDKQQRLMLDPLAKALGIEIKVQPELPALDLARNALAECMQGTGDSTLAK